MFHEVLHHNLEKKTLSLVKVMQYDREFSTIATQYENVNCQYENVACKEHESFIVTLTGLHVDANHPEIGASPDGLIECKCCRKGVLEINALTNTNMVFTDVMRKKVFHWIEMEN